MKINFEKQPAAGNWQLPAPLKKLQTAGCEPLATSR